MRITQIITIEIRTTFYPPRYVRAHPTPEQIDNEVRVLEARERYIRQQIKYELACAELEDVRALVRHQQPALRQHDQPIRALEYQPMPVYDAR